LFSSKNHKFGFLTKPNLHSTPVLVYIVVLLYLSVPFFKKGTAFWFFFQKKND